MNYFSDCKNGLFVCDCNEEDGLNHSHKMGYSRKRNKFSFISLSYTYVQ